MARGPRPTPPPPPPDCGFTGTQAETLADEHVALLDDNPVTGTGIAKVEARIEAVKADLPKWLFDAPIAQGGLIVAVIELP